MSVNMAAPGSEFTQPQALFDFTTLITGRLATSRVYTRSRSYKFGSLLDNSSNLVTKLHFTRPQIDIGSPILDSHQIITVTPPRSFLSLSINPNG